MIDIVSALVVLSLGVAAIAYTWALVRVREILWLESGGA